MKKLFKSLLFVPVLVLTSCGSDPDANLTWDNYFTVNQDEIRVTLQELRRKGRWDCENDSTGNLKCLVVPVEFTDYPSSKFDAGSQGTLDHIELAYFGGDKYENPTLNWESVKSFYYKSSYGKLNITGTVQPWYHLNCSSEEFIKRDKPVQNLVKELYEYYSTGEGSNTINLKDYDGNNDGYVDMVHVIYSHPNSVASNQQGSNIFWAYTDQYQLDSRLPEPETDAFFSRYVWASYDFLYQDVNYTPIGGCRPFTPEDRRTNAVGCVDAHTYIHETGHCLGLNDYYSYTNKNEQPLGKLDMMDHNIGDHCAYSKAVLGWIDPIVVTGNAKITLDPFNESGQAILVPIREMNWKENSYTMLDEYLMIEYLTPEGLAADDAFLAFRGETQPKYYNKPGVRITHIDSRMMEWINHGATYESVNYIHHPDQVRTAGHFPDLAHENTAENSIGDCRLIELVEPSGRRHHRGISGNSLLFTNVDKEYGKDKNDKLNNFKMNTINNLTEKPYDLGFSIEVTNIDANENTATIEIRVVD